MLFGLDKLDDQDRVSSCFKKFVRNPKHISNFLKPQFDLLWVLCPIGLNLIQKSKILSNVVELTYHLYFIYSHQTQVIYP